MPGLARLLVLLLAGVAWAAACPWRDVWSWQAPVALLGVLGALAPFYLESGGRVPDRRIGLLLAPALAIPLLLVFVPYGRYIAASDIETGATVVAIAAGLVLAIAVHRSLRMD